MSRCLGIVVCLFALAVSPAWAEDPPPPPTPAPAAADSAPDVDPNLLCPYDDCDGSGGGGYGGCYDCDTMPGTGATCYTDGRHWADCQGGSICWYMPGVGWHCEPYCGRRRCYNV